MIGFRESHPLAVAESPSEGQRHPRHPVARPEHLCFAEYRRGDDTQVVVAMQVGRIRREVRAVNMGPRSRPLHPRASVWLARVLSWIAETATVGVGSNGLGHELWRDRRAGPRTGFTSTNDAPLAFPVVSGSCQAFSVPSRYASSSDSGSSRGVTSRKIRKTTCDTARYFVKSGRTVISEEHRRTALAIDIADRTPNARAS